MSKRACWMSCVLLLALAAAEATAQAWPARPLRVIVPFPAGAGIDSTVRLLAPRLTESLGKPVIIDNRPGAGGAVGLELAARAAPDGYVMVWCSATHVIQGILTTRPAFDFFRDLAPVTEVISSPYLLVIFPQLPARSVRELVVHAKASAGRLNYASIGAGSLQQLSMELFSQAVGIKVVEVPYKGIAAMLPDLIAGRTHLAMSSLASMVSHVRARSILALAVTSTERTQALPDLPTMIEAGVPGFVVTQWQGAMVPAGTPQAVVERLHGDILKALRHPDVAAGLANDGVTAVGSPPRQFKAALEAERGKWAKVIKQAGIKLE